MISLTQNEVNEAGREDQAWLLVDAATLEIVHVNSLLERMFGYDVTPNELIGKQLSVLIPPELRDLHDSHVRQYILNPVSRIMRMGGLDGYRRDGTRIKCLVILSSRVFPRVPATILSARVVDISAGSPSQIDFKPSPGK